MNNPAPDNETTLTEKRKVPWPFIFLIIIFGLPYLLSWYLLSTDDPLFFKKGQSNGELITPLKQFINCLF